MKRKLKSVFMYGLIAIALVVASQFIQQNKNVVEYIKEEVIITEVINPLDEQIEKRTEELEEKYRSIQNLEATLDVLKAENERIETEIKSIEAQLADFILEMQ